MLDRLRSIVGPGAVRAGDEARWAVHGVVPKAVVAPASAEEAAAVLALASGDGWVVEPAGAGACLDGGRVPGRVDLVLTTERLAEVVEYEPADLTASVGAGIRMAALAARFGAHRQWLPLDPPGHPGATLGAIVSTASAGPLRLAYGTPRDHVLGLQLVTGDGRILELGGKVVKNVAGYDLVKLVVGSRGTLGIVTRVNVRLRPIPAADATVALLAPAPDRLVAAFQAMREARIEAAALELVSPALAGSLLGEPDAWALLARFQGNAEAVEAARSRLPSVAQGARVEALSPERAEAAWSGLSAEEARAALAVRLADRPSELAGTLATAARLFPGSPVAAHAGDGIARVLVPAPEGAATSSWVEAIAEARSAMAARGGTAIVARGPRAILEGVDPYGPVGPALRLMQALKKEFDPAGILAPGRFVV